MIKAYITNLGKYNEGELCGEYLKLPAQKEDVQSLLSRIGVDGVLYEEFFITDYETDIPGLCKYMGEYESIDELNYLASLLEDMESWELDKFEAAVDFGECNSVQDYINLAQNLDCFELYSGIEDDEDLGRFYIEEMCTLEVPEHLENYIDYEAYGRDMGIDEDGRFINGGYVVRTGDSFTEHYNGRDDMPDEYRIFAYPETEKMNMRDRLSMYRQMVPALPTTEKIAPMREERA